MKNYYANKFKINMAKIVCFHFIFIIKKYHQENYVFVHMLLECRIQL